MAQFDPYRFTPALIDDLVVSCIHGDDDAPAARPEPQPRQRSGGPGLWNRLFGRR
jgi:hypothetical protein